MEVTADGHTWRGGGPWLRWRDALGLALAWLPAVIVLLPLLVVTWRALQPAEEAWRQVVEYRLAGYLTHSAGLAAGVLLLALLFGISSAWVISVYEFAGRRTLEWAMLLPLAVPGYVAALAYVDVMEGLVPAYVWIRTHHGLASFRAAQQVAPWLLSIIVLAATLYPYVFLSCRAAFGRRAAGAVDAARVLGAGRLTIFWSIALPLARPAIAAGGSLVALETLNDVGVVAAFGLPTLTPGIFRVWGEGHPGVAMRMALLLLGFALLSGVTERLLRGRRRFAISDAGRTVPRRSAGWSGSLGAWLICGVPLTLGLLVPGVRLVRWAVLSWDIVEWDVFALAATHSLVVALTAVGCILAATILLVAGRRAWRLPSIALAERLSILGYASPAALVAVGVGFLISRAADELPGAGGLALSVSILGLVVASFIRYLAACVQPVSAGIARVPVSFHDAARVLGAGPMRAFRKIDLPLLLPALCAGATLAFLDILKELPMTLVLRPFGYETVSTLIFRLVDEARVPEAAVPGLFLVCCSLPGLLPLNYLLRQSTRERPL